MVQSDEITSMRHCKLSAVSIYCPIFVSALRSGAPEIFINPSSGRFISSIIKIAPETDSAQTSKITTTVAFLAVTRPKPAKMIASQRTSNTRKRIGVVPSPA
jgi:transglutaminase/protease-like cytokinesis protein 3